MASIEYRQIPGWIGYMASSEGDIYSVKSSKFLAQGYTKRGYKEVKLSKNGKAKTNLVHRLIASAFLGESSKSVDHINFNKEDNRISNLRFVDAIENHSIAVLNKRIKSGSNHYGSLFNKEQIFEIRNSKLSNSELASIYKTTSNLIYKIKTFRSYRDE